jgi:3-dehydroquinate synthase
VDAALGGKAGVDLFGIKNLAGSFYPAEIVYMPFDCLASLPLVEWKSGMAELIKTAADGIRNCGRVLIGDNKEI